jgi:hypothetical protein
MAPPAMGFSGCFFADFRGVKMDQQRAAFMFPTLAARGSLLCRGRQ